MVFLTNAMLQNNLNKYRVLQHPKQDFGCSTHESRDQFFHLCLCVAILKLFGLVQAFCLGKGFFYKNIRFL